MIEIDTYYTKFRKYITYSIGQIENFYKYSKNLFSYSNFNSNLQETLTFLKSIFPITRYYSTSS